jgi:hypothetical protein
MEDLVSSSDFGENTHTPSFVIGKYNSYLSQTDEDNDILNTNYSTSL